MKKVKKWIESNGEIPGILLKDCVCVCNPPLRVSRNGEKREKWIGQDEKTKTKLYGNLVVVTGCVVIILLMVNQLLHTHSQEKNLIMKSRYRNREERYSSTPFR